MSFYKGLKDGFANFTSKNWYQDEINNFRSHLREISIPFEPYGQRLTDRPVSL